MNYSLFENIEKPVFVLDNYGIVQYANKCIVDLFSINNIDAKGKHYSDFFKSKNIISVLDDYLANFFFEDKNLIKSVKVENNLNENLLVTINPLISNTLFSVIIDNNEELNDYQQYKEKYNSLIDNIKIGIVVYEAVNDGNDFIIKDINKEGLLMDSLDKEFIVNKRITEIFPGIKEFGLLDVFKNVWRTGIAENHPISLYKDNVRIGWRSNIVYKLSSGEIVAVYSDETKNVKARKEYKELNKWFSLFLDNFPGYAYIRSLDGEVYYANKKFKEDIHFQSQNGENIRNHRFSIEDLNQFREQDISVLKENESRSYEDVINDCYLLTTKFPLSFGKKENIIGGISVDITSRRKNEILLTKLNEFKNTLLSLIGHDLKNPFNVQLGFLEMIINDYYSFTDEKRLEYLKIIFNSTSGSYQLLNNLLEWSNENMNEISYKPIFIQLNTIVERIISQNNLNLSVKNLTIESDISDNINVFADENMLEVVIRNIIANAIKFSKPKGIINISAKYIDSEVVISVEDSGIGMSESLKSKLFEMTFDKVRNGTKGERGTGLGLYLCNEFMKKNNGRIIVDSEINKGSKFFLYLPASE